MDEECLCLTWKNQGVIYQQMLNHLRVENILTDCTLACDGQKFSVHRLVLVTCSEFFKSLLEDVPCQHPIVYLRGINGSEMQALIDFMYLGKVDVPQREMSNLLSTAEALQIKGLGVFKTCIKEETGRNSEKRKRSPISSDSEVSEMRSLNKTISSLHTVPGVSENNSDTLFSPLKRHHKEPLGNEINSSGLSCSNDSGHMDDNQSIQKCEKGNVYSKSKKIEKANAASLKSSPNANYLSSPIPLPSEFDSQSLPVPESTNYTLSNRSSATECGSLTKLAPLQLYLPDHSRSSDYYTNYLEDHPVSRMAGMPHYFNESRSKEEPYEHLSSVKEETESIQNSPSGKREHAMPASHCANDLVPKDNASHLLDNISRSPNALHLPYLQDENLENGADSSRPYHCPICRKSFAKVAILKRHHLAHFRPYNCHLCSRSFTRREVLAEHVLEHNGADLRLPCPVCKMTIKRKRNLQAHIKVKHPEYHKQKAANNEALC